MAITDVPAFTHLTEADVENLAVELDAIRQDIEDSRGERDSRYIRRTIAAQRALEVTGRLTLAASSRRSAWWAGTLTLGVAKIVENMEIGHNVMHGQWDWMNDREIHSSTWEWDMSGASKHWRFTHNFMHHKYTNILGMDDDVGYGVLRVTRDERWKPFNLSNLLFNTLLAIGFEWGIGLQPLEFEKFVKGQSDRKPTLVQVREFSIKAGRRVVKDYAAFPAVTSLSPGATYKSTLTANAVANVIRNVGANAVIVRGHFPDGAEKFTRPVTAKPPTRVAGRLTRPHGMVAVGRSLARIPGAIFQNLVPPHPGFPLKFDQQAARDVDQTNDQLQMAVGLCEVRPNTGPHKFDSVGGITPLAYDVDCAAVKTLMLLHNRSLP